MRSFETVAVECDGRVAAWGMNRNTGVSLFTGDADMVQQAKMACVDGDPVRLSRHVEVEAGDDDALCALAALVSWNPGRTLVVDAPEWVWSQLLRMEEDFTTANADCEMLSW